MAIALVETIARFTAIHSPLSEFAFLSAHQTLYTNARNYSYCFFHRKHISKYLNNLFPSIFRYSIKNILCKNVLEKCVCISIVAKVGCRANGKGKRKIKNNKCANFTPAVHVVYRFQIYKIILQKSTSIRMRMTTKDVKKKKQRLRTKTILF